MKYLALLILIASCTTAEKLTYKAIGKDRAKVAEITRKEWPCVTTTADTTYRTDTVTDIITVQCPDTISYRVDSFETVTAVRVPVYVKVPMQREVKNIKVVQKVEDSAKIFAMQDHATRLQADNAKVQAEADKYQSARNKWRKWFFMLAGIVGLYIAFKLFRSKIGL